MIISLIAAIAVLYLTAGRGVFALYGAITKAPMSYSAMRATATGAATQGEADILTALLFLLALAAWPLMIGFMVYASLLKKRTGKAAQAKVLGVDLSTDPKAHANI